MPPRQRDEEQVDRGKAQGVVKLFGEGGGWRPPKRFQQRAYRHLSKEQCAATETTDANIRERSETSERGVPITNRGREGLGGFRQALHLYSA
jgi:hypothetical protein